MRDPLAPRQQAVLDFLAAAIAENGYAPTIREIGSHFGITLNGVATHLRALRAKGAIDWEPGLARTLRVLDKFQGGKPEETE